MNYGGYLVTLVCLCKENVMCIRCSDVHLFFFHLRMSTNLYKSKRYENTRGRKQAHDALVAAC